MGGECGVTEVVAALQEVTKTLHVAVLEARGVGVVVCCAGCLLLVVGCWLLVVLLVSMLAGGGSIRFSGGAGILLSSTLSFGRGHRPL